MLRPGSVICNPKLPVFSQATAAVPAVTNNTVNEKISCNEYTAESFIFLLT
jgi:hypothetical protein